MAIRNGPLQVDDRLGTVLEEWIQALDGGPFHARMYGFLRRLADYSDDEGNVEADVAWVAYRCGGHDKRLGWKWVMQAVDAGWVEVVPTVAGRLSRFRLVVPERGL